MKLMTNKKILGIIALAAGAFLLYNNYQKKKDAEEKLRIIQQQYQNRPPPQASNDWYKWISIILSLYKDISSLWDVGGPFYKSNVPNPKTDPSGWAKVLAQIDYF